MKPEEAETHKKLVEGAVLAGWAKRCGAECAKEWNETVGKALGPEGADAVTGRRSRLEAGHRAAACSEERRMDAALDGVRHSPSGACGSAARWFCSPRC